MIQTTQKTIYIESTALSRARRTGVDYWVEGIISRIVADSPEVEFVFFRFSEDGDQLRISGKNVRQVIINKMPAKLYRALLLIGIAPSLESLIDLSELNTVIFPNFNPWPVATKQVTIYSFIADVAFADHPEFVPNWYHRRLLRRGVNDSVRNSNIILTCSEYSKKRMAHIFQAKPSNIHVLYPGYEKSHGAMTKSATVTEQYILFVGTLEPRKNVANLIKAYLKLSPELRKEYKLILAGGKGWLDDEILELVSENAESIVTPGYVDDTQKQALYTHATLLVYPAFYEGFGMPIIEAQARGVPVLTCRNSSLVEAGGDAAAYCEPDPKSIADAMTKLLSNRSELTRLARAGRIHASSFTWEKPANRLKYLLGI